MKLSVNWLRESVALDMDAEEIARRLTTLGLEVESQVHLQPTFSGVVVARVLEAVRHPNADKLQVARVDTGREVLSIVCGAANCRAGLNVALALPGARLPGDFEIKVSKIRGETSHGMLCSEKELGLSTESEGIIELPDSMELGQAIAAVLGLEDWILETSPTAKRGDLLSHLGVARELAAVLGQPLLRPDVGQGTSPSTLDIGLQIDAPSSCGRYIGRVVRGLGVAPSPLWMRRRLEAVGVRPINNLVDVTNYVLMECGQPLHAFDLRRLSGGKIVVRNAREPESMTTLDGQSRALCSTDLLICDGERPVALAGVMGGLNTEISADTTDVFLESAWFEPKGVRATSRRLGLRSESSHRFERGVDPALTDWASRRAAALLANFSAAGTSPSIDPRCVDARGATPERVSISFRPAQTNRLLGTTFNSCTQRVALTRLGFEADVQDSGELPWQVVVPTWRPDVTQAADLIEEVARYIGFDQIPTPPARATLSARTGHARDARLRLLRGLLQSRGCHQALNLTFVSRSRLSPFDASEPVALHNPLNEELSVLRSTLLPGLMANVAHNLRHGADGFAAFEVGRVFAAGPEGERPRESERIALVLCGSPAGHFSGKARAYDFFDLKALVDELVQVAVGRVPVWTSGETPAFLHPGLSAKVSLADANLGVGLHDLSLGRGGALHPATARALELDAPVFVAELDLGPLLDRPGRAVAFQDFMRVPAVRRDLAVIVSTQTLSADVLAAIRALSLQLIDDTTIFDIYEGASVGPGRYSLGLSLRLRARDRTLTEDEINGVVQRVLTELTAKFGATLR